MAIVHNRKPQRKSTRMAAKHLSGNLEWVKEDKGGNSISAETVRRTLRAEGLRYRRSKRKPKLTQAQRDKRVAFAHQMLLETEEAINPDWIFIDESSMTLHSKANPTHSGYWITEDEKAPTQGTVKYDYTSVKWIAAIGSQGKTKLLFCPDGKLSSAQYCRLLSKLLPTDELRRISDGDPVYFIQDGDSSHTAQRTTRYLQKRHINFVSCGRKGFWPANSPDLNPIENLWAILKDRVRKREPKTIPELKQFITEEWEEIPDEMMRGLVDSFPGRLRSVIECGGAALDH